MKTKFINLIILISMAIALGCSKKASDIFRKDIKCGDRVIPSSVYKQKPYEIKYSITGNKSIKLRYLGCGGFYIGNEKAALLIDPFFSNVSLFQKELKTLSEDVELGLKDLEKDIYEKVLAILVSHSHYDHLQDVPYVYEKFTNWLFRIVLCHPFRFVSATFFG